MELIQTIAVAEAAIILAALVLAVRMAVATVKAHHLVPGVDLAPVQQISSRRAVRLSAAIAIAQLLGLYAATSRMFHVHSDWIPYGIARCMVAVILGYAQLMDFRDRNRISDIFRTSAGMIVPPAPEPEQQPEEQER